MDSASRSDATVLLGVSPPELLSSINERVGESSSAHHMQLDKDVCMFVEENSANCKDNDKASAEFSMDFTPKVKYLQVGSITSLHGVVLFIICLFFFLMPYCHLLISFRWSFIVISYFC